MTNKDKHKISNDYDPDPKWRKYVVYAMDFLFYFGVITVLLFVLVHASGIIIFT